MSLKKIIKKVLENIIRGIILPPLLIEFEGSYNIPKDKPCIISGNHVSSYDAIALTGLMGDEIRFMGKKELENKWHSKMAAKIFDIILVEKSKADVSALKEAYKTLDENKKLGIFPEGTRNGIIKGVPLKEGPIVISIKKNVPIIPVSISGKMKMFSKNKIVIGKPIYFKKELKEGKKIRDKEEIERLNAILWKKIVDGLEEKDRQKYLKAFSENYNLKLN